MSNIYHHRSHNKRQTWLLFSVFSLLLIFLGWLFSYYLGDPGILYIAVAISFLSSFFSYYFSDKIVLSFSGAKKIEKKDNPELYRLVENLCISSGLPLPRIYVINDPAPNAFATGRNYKTACLAFTTGLLASLEKAELEGVVAHELSHIKNKDILVATVATVLVGVIVLLADFFLRYSFFGQRRKSEGNGQIALIISIVAIFFAILAPFFAYLMQFAISRKREFLADAEGAFMTRYPEGLARALEKISRYPGEMKRANQATAHLYIASPFREEGKKKHWLSKTFATHPPVADRISRLREMNL